MSLSDVDPGRHVTVKEGLEIWTPPDRPSVPQLWLCNPCAGAPVRHGPSSDSCWNGRWIRTRRDRSRSEAHGDRPPLDSGHLDFPRVGEPTDESTFTHVSGDQAATRSLADAVGGR